MTDARTPLSPDERDALQALHAKAERLLAAACQRGQLRMSIPARPDEDDDLVISTALCAIPRLLDETERLREEIARLSKPTHFFNADGWEYTTTDPDILTDGLYVGEVMEVGRLVSLPNRFLARVPTALDEDGCAEDEELQWFDTEEEAKAALLAARQAGTAESVSSTAAPGGQA